MNFPTFDAWLLRQVCLGLPETETEYESDRELFADIYTTVDAR